MKTNFMQWEDDKHFWTLKQLTVSTVKVHLFQRRKISFLSLGLQNDLHYLHFPLNESFKCFTTDH